LKFLTGFVWIDPTHYLPLARTADEVGWDGIVLPDHLVHLEQIATRYPYAEDGERPWQPEDPYPDVWVSIGAMAAVTERVQFHQGVYVVPLRNPFVLAKAAGTAAILSGGRVTLGLGLGWMKEEFDLVGERFDARGRRAEEMVEVMRKLWTGEMVEHHGEFYDFPRLQMRPAAPQGIPIWVGGRTEAALRRVARVGDGWIPDILDVKELAAGIAKIERYRGELGRPEAPLDVIGAPKEGYAIDDFRRMEDAGVTHIWVIPWLIYDADPTTLEAQRDALVRFGDEVIAKMR
jgi:probable F420-dependent oxidoreductase